MNEEPITLDEFNRELARHCTEGTEGEKKAEKKENGGTPQPPDQCQTHYSGSEENGA